MVDGKLKVLANQFGRFLIIGAMNTVIDVVALNLLMWQTGIYKGLGLIPLTAIAFTIAVINSFFWNKFWTFKAPAKVNSEISSVDPGESIRQTRKQFSQFILVTLIGLGINTGIVYGVTTFIPPMFGLNEVLWANLAKAISISISLVWNFTGYRMFVFKK